MDAAGDAVRELLSGPLGHRPTALFASQNLLTMGAVRVLRELGLQRTIAVVGFDDVMLGDLVEPGLTVVAQDPSAMGTAASELLFRRMDGDTGPTQLRIIPTRLIVRGSGEIPPPPPSVSGGGTAAGRAASSSTTAPHMDELITRPRRARTRGPAAPRSRSG